MGLDGTTGITRLKVNHEGEHCEGYHQSSEQAMGQKLDHSGSAVSFYSYSLLPTFYGVRIISVFHSNSKLRVRSTSFFFFQN